MADNSQIQFIPYLAGHLQGLLSKVLIEDEPSITGKLFKKTQKVLLSGQTGNNNDYFLKLIDSNLIEEHPLGKEEDIFYKDVDGTTVDVYRSPMLMNFTFELVSKGLECEQLLMTQDGVMNFFFDNPEIAPIFPESFKKNRELTERMYKIPGKLTMLSKDKFTNRTQSQWDHIFTCFFSYTGPFHSGNAMRQDKYVTQRLVKIEE